MTRFAVSCFLSCMFFLFATLSVSAQPDSMVLRDITWDERSPARSTELFIPSDGVQLAGLLYRANGPGKHPTVLVLHGFPGNERNLDLAQAIRAHGWNAIYFDYRGSWGSQGKFSFRNCIDDVVNVVAFCKKNQDSLQIDTANIVLFGHSMGGWISLKAVQRLPGIRKCFALSAWDIYPHYYRVMTKPQLAAFENDQDAPVKYFVLNAGFKEMFDPVKKDTVFYNLANDGMALAHKQIVMLDESNRNSMVADSIKSANTASFEYVVWPTDHNFTNKRISLINKFISFLDK